MLNKELPKTYNPADYEDAIYAKWEKSGFFNPDNLKGEPYSIMMPPPNVTGVLHLGHALENSLMDIMARYQRMNGKKVLLLPGTDHAAVATQAKVEKVLVGQGIKNPRQELGREKLLEKIREYAEESKSTILKQIRKMGTSCDWSRLAYTFDEKRCRAVNEVFIKMYNDGLIYRGNRVVNWSVKGQSTCSDDELVHVERPAKFYTFKYSKDFPIAVATTRPETKLGDTAVAVNPNDKRYKKYIGKIFTVDVGAAKPLEIKIIADEAVDENFGTGAVGVTPAHSMVDFEMYEKQKAKNDPIALISVIDQNGKMAEAAGKEYAGLSVLEAREKFIGWLKKEKLLEKEEDIMQNVGTSDRFSDAIEVLPMTQWFIDVNKKIPNKDKSLKDLMREAVTTGHNGDKEQKVKITPERFEKVYLNWINNLRDWCISRQIWWGHRIPVWYKGGEIYVGAETPKGEDWIQDEDTLDTWFSSGLWTFSTLGWPSKSPLPPFAKGGNKDLETFHPTSWMQMGYEILFFWMARMILMSTYALDQIPFKDVYIHGMLRSESGKKFSKSSGNNIDPLEIISKFGTDALRLSVIGGIAPGNDSKFYEEKVEAQRNFVNKIWNVSRFILSSVDKKYYSVSTDKLPEAETLSDKWILDRLLCTTRTATKYTEQCFFSQASELLIEFTCNDFSDWYLEASKFENSSNRDEILVFVLKYILKLWHPFIPFVTEVVWGEFNNSMIMVESWSKYLEFNDKWVKFSENGVSNQFKIIQDVISAVRNARSENKVEPAKKVEAVIYAGNKMEFIKGNEILIKNLKTGINNLNIFDKGEKLSDAIYVAVGDIEIYLLGAVDAAKEKVRIEKEIANLEKIIASAEVRLANKEFIDKAPAEIIKKEKEKLKNCQAELKSLKSK